MGYYTLKVDGNGRPIYEAIEELKRVDVPTTVAGEFDVKIPWGSPYGFMFKRCDVDAEFQVNGGDWIPLDEGDRFTPYYNLKSLKVRVKAVGTNPIVVIFVL